MSSVERLSEDEDARVLQEVRVGKRTWLAMASLAMTAVILSGAVSAIITARAITGDSTGIRPVMPETTRVKREAIGPPPDISRKPCHPDSLAKGELCDGVYVSGNQTFYYPPRRGRFPTVHTPSSGRDKRSVYTVVTAKRWMCPVGEECEDQDKEIGMEMGVKFSPINTTHTYATPFVVGHLGGWYKLVVNEFQVMGGECHTLCSPIVGLVSDNVFDQFAQPVTRMVWIEGLKNWYFAGGDMTNAPYPFILTRDRKEVRYCSMHTPMLCGVFGDLE